MATAMVVDDRPATPERDLAQRLDALARANRVRSWRAEMKRDVKGGRRTITGLLGAPPEKLETMKVLDLILLAPKVGRVKAMKMLNAARIAPSKTVGGLSERQRRELLVLLGTVGHRR